MDEDGDIITPLTLVIEPEARDNLRDAVEWLQTLPFPDAAERFAEMIDRELPGLCYSVAERLITGLLPPRPDEEASEGFSRPVYKELLFTSGRNRSGAGGWRVYFALSDEDGDGDTDTLSVVAIAHATGGPVGNV